jgi:hypothetical protein
VCTDTSCFDTNTYTALAVGHCTDAALHYNSNGTTNWKFTWIIAVWMYKLSCEDQVWPKHAVVGWDMVSFSTHHSAGPLNPLISDNVFPTAQRYAALRVRTRHLKHTRTDGKTEIRSNFENSWMSSSFIETYIYIYTCNCVTQTNKMHTLQINVLI